MNPQNAAGASAIQGSSPVIQGSSPSLQKTASPQVTVAPSTNQNISNYAPATVSPLSNSEESTIASLLKSIQSEEAADAPGVAANLNLNSLNAQAQSSASKTVNPLYTQYLNQYLQEQAANQKAATAQNTLNIQGEQSSLSNTLAQNTLQENAAASTNALTQGNINVQQQNYQLTTGNAQVAKLQAIDQSIGSGDLGASGLGQQQIYNAENARNTADAAQLGQFQYQRDTSNLSTQDTFEQLAQSSAYATTQEGESEAQTNFNLNDYLRQAAYNDTQYQEALASSKQQALTATTEDTLAKEIQDAIVAQQGTGGKNYAASEQAYSSLLTPTTSLPTAPNQNDYINSYGSTV